MSRRPLIAGNWKMFRGPVEADALAAQQKRIADWEQVKTSAIEKMRFDAKRIAELEQMCKGMAAEGDHLATIGENRKLLAFPLDQVPEMARGKGVRLQRFKDGGLSDARAFNLKQGLSWTDSSGRNFTVTDLKEWIGERAQSGKLPPKGFPKSNRFG